MSTRIALYKDIEVRLEIRGNGDVLAAIELPSGPVWVSSKTETDAILQVKIFIDIHLLGLGPKPLN